MRIWVLVALGCGACAAGAPKPSAAPLAADAAEAAESYERRPYAELVRAPAPAELSSPGVWLHASSATQLVQKLAAALPTLSVIQSFQDLGAIVGHLYGADVASVVDPAAPLDIALPLPKNEGDEPPIVVAFRVRSPGSIEQGRAGLTLRRKAAGTWRIGDEPASDPPPPSEDVEWDDDVPEEERVLEPSQAGRRMPCLLMHAAAPVGYRVLCGNSVEHIQQVAPFLLGRSEPGPADVHLELGGPAYRATLDEGVAALKRETEAEGQSGSDKLGSEVALAVVENLAAHDHVSLDLRLGAQGAELTLEVGFPRTPATQAFQDWALAASKRQLPPSFGLLPADSGYALAFAGLGRETTSAFFTRLLRELAVDMQQEFVLSPHELDEIQQSFIGMLPDDARVSFALGLDAAEAERALHSDAVRSADDAKTPLKAAAVKQLQASLGGWLTVGIDVAPKDYLPAVERMYRANAIPMRRRPNMPRKDTEREDSTMKGRPVTTRGLPASTIHLVDQVTPAKTYRPPLDGSEPPILPYESHWLVVPDGARVWIVIARSEALAGQRALALLSGAGRLTQRPGVQPASEQPTLAAFSFSVAGLSLQSLSWDSLMEREASRLAFSRYGRSLRSASEPMLVTLQAVPRAATAPGFDLRAKAQLTPAAVEQLFTSRMPELPPP